jgi:hypothetical protein
MNRPPINGRVVLGYIGGGLIMLAGLLGLVTNWGEQITIPAIPHYLLLFSFGLVMLGLILRSNMQDPRK